MNNKYKEMTIMNDKYEIISLFIKNGMPGLEKMQLF